MILAGAAAIRYNAGVSGGGASRITIMPEPLVAEPIRLTYEDFLALPDDGKRYEILDGDLYMSPSPRTLHQRLLLRLAIILGEHVRCKGLGEVFIAPFDVVLGDNDIVEPDIVFVSEANRSIITEENIRGVPDLLVEVLSPTRPQYDLKNKRAVYARCGVPFYWIVDPEGRRLTELQLLDRAYAIVGELAGKPTFEPRLFPGLGIDLERLWT